jgi:hypothetical protein
MKRQRGDITSSLIIYAIIAVVGGVGIFGAYRWAYNRGADSVQEKWDEANRIEAKKEAERKAGEEKILAAEKTKREVAERQAAQAELNWKEAVDAARKEKRKLAGVVCPPPAVGVPAKPALGTPPSKPTFAPSPFVLEGGGDLRFTWEFVGLYDSIWTDREGKPVHGTPQGILKGAGQTDATALAPYGPQEVIEAHGKNAVRCSSIERLYNSLLDTIQKLEKDWNRAMAANPS